MKLFIASFAFLFSVCVAQAGAPAGAKNIVIVHGAFVDGSGWEGVFHVLTKDGYNVSIVQNTTLSLAADVTATQNVLANQNGPVVLVGHSYGGEVITQAGDDAKVKALVYVAAFAPEVGESLESLNAGADPRAAAPPILPPQNGFLWLDPAKFADAFAADVDRDKANFMAASQVPLAVQTFTDKVTKAAWKTKPSYYIVSSDDQTIPPSVERKLAARAGATTYEIKASHAVYVSQPEKVARVIEEAATK